MLPSNSPGAGLAQAETDRGVTLDEARIIRAIKAHIAKGDKAAEKA
jgi:hypothetical protein